MAFEYLISWAEKFLKGKEGSLNESEVRRLIGELLHALKVLNYPNARVSIALAERDREWAEAQRLEKSKEHVRRALRFHPYRK